MITVQCKIQEISILVISIRLWKYVAHFVYLLKCYILVQFQITRTWVVFPHFEGNYPTFYSISLVDLVTNNFSGCTLYPSQISYFLNWLISSDNQKTIHI